MLRILEVEDPLADESSAPLVLGLKCLTLKLSAKVLDTDWDCPEAVAHSDRLMKVLSAYGRNIEKCVAMTDKSHQNDPSDKDLTDAEADRLRRELQRRLERYAQRLGDEELARRVAERERLSDDARLGILVPTGPNSSEDA